MKITIQQQLEGLRKLSETLENKEDKILLSKVSITIRDFAKHLDTDKGEFSIIKTFSEQGYRDYINYQKRTRNEK